MPPTIDPAVVSKLADTIPSIAGILAILGVLIPVGLYMARMLRAAVKDAGSGMSEALKNNTAALDRLRDRDDARSERHFEVMQQLGERCLSDHRASAEKIGNVADKVDSLHADLTAIRDRLGKD